MQFHFDHARVHSLQNRDNSFEGHFFQALFFACLLILMSKNDITFLWPLTSLTFVFATVAAIVFLHERVTPIRWVGVVFIIIGAAIAGLFRWLFRRKRAAASDAMAMGPPSGPPDGPPAT